MRRSGLAEYDEYHGHPSTWEVVKSSAMCCSFGCLLMALPLMLLLHGVHAFIGRDDMMKAAHASLDLTEKDFAVQLLGNNATGNSKAGHSHAACVVEFYASWCPHCHHYAPIFDKAARYFKHLRDKGELDVLVARIDCAANFGVCNKFKQIPGYPHILVGHCIDFVHFSANISAYGQKRPQDLTAIVGKFINKTLLYKEIAAPPAPVGNSTSVKKPHPGQGQVWTLRDVESATRMQWHIMTNTYRMYNGLARRDGMYALVKWWAASHPSPSCQAGAQQLLAGFHTTYWPLPANMTGNATEAPPQLRQYKICGKEAKWVEEEGSWLSCYSDKEGARGFTCGLWLLFHASAARLPQLQLESTGGPPARLMTDALQAFAQHFFACMICQMHFSKVMSRPVVSQLSTQRDTVLWVWRTHNEVNARLAKVEETYGHSATGDLDYPKVQWPSLKECPSCRKPTPSLVPAGSTTSSGSGGAVVVVAAGGDTAALDPTSAPPIGIDGGATPADSYNDTSGIVWVEDEVYRFLERTFHIDPPVVTPLAASPPDSSKAGSGSVLGRKGGGGGGGAEGGTNGGEQGIRQVSGALPTAVTPSSSLLMWPLSALLFASCAVILWGLHSTLRGRPSLSSVLSFLPGGRGPSASSRYGQSGVKGNGASSQVVSVAFSGSSFLHLPRGARPIVTSSSYADSTGMQAAGYAGGSAFMSGPRNGGADGSDSPRVLDRPQHGRHGSGGAVMGVDVGAGGDRGSAGLVGQRRTGGSSAQHSPRVMR